MAGDAVDDPEGEDREPEGDCDRKSAGPRDGSRMHATPTGHVEIPKSFRKPTDKRRDRGRKKECNNSRADEENAGHSAER